MMRLEMERSPVTSTSPLEPTIPVLTGVRRAVRDVDRLDGIGKLDHQGGTERGRLFDRQAQFDEHFAKLFSSLVVAVHGCRVRKLLHRQKL